MQQSGVPGPRQPRCSESALELLCTEAVSHYSIQGAAGAVALEAIGFRIGRQLVERYTRDRPRLGDTLDIIKYVCKEFWLAVFKKQIDNLRTNHRGVYVLQDNSFRWLLRLAPLAAADGVRDEGTRRLVASYLSLPCGIVRGALCHLGVACSVEADAKILPACAFTVKIIPAQ